jgi:hypothetical protein
MQNITVRGMSRVGTAVTVMDDSTPTPTQQKRPRVAEENRKRAVRAYAIAREDVFAEWASGSSRPLP